MKTSLVTVVLQVFLVLISPLAVGEDKNRPTSEQIDKVVKHRQMLIDAMPEDARQEFLQKLSERSKSKDLSKWKSQAISRRENYLKQKNLAWNARPTFPQIDLRNAGPGDFGTIGQTTGNTSVIYVFQVIDSDSFIAEVGDFHIWIDGVDTSVLGDKKTVSTELDFFVVGNTTYDTALSQRTILRAVPMSKDVRKEFERKSIVDRTREWTITGINEPIRGELVSFVGKKVTIKKVNGESLELTYLRLSKEDREYVTDALGAEEVK